MALTDGREDGKKELMSKKTTTDGAYFRWQFIADLRSVLDRQFQGEQEDGYLSDDDVDDVLSALQQCCRKWESRAQDSMAAWRAREDQ
jgi:hypothetical protein